MGIIAACIVPHPPMAVDAIGGDDRKWIPKTLASYETTAKDIAALRPDTIVLTSPHSLMYSNYFHISPGRGAYGDFAQFRAPQVKMHAVYDDAFVSALSAACEQEKLPAGTLGEQDPRLDHGTMVPLYFLEKYYREYQLVRIGLSGLSLDEHYRFGKLIAQTAEASGKRIVFIASGDLSHCQKEDGPYGYHPMGPVYDDRLREVVSRGTLKQLVNFDESFLKKAQECGHRSFVIMAGALDDRAYTTQWLSHENTFGVGYGFAMLHVTGKKEAPADFREYLQEARRASAGEGTAKSPEADGETEDETMKAAAVSDACVDLARQTIEAHVRGERLPRANALSEEMTGVRAGTFVSVHKHGALRGCIGTIMATKPSLGEEIIANAVSAASRDPRFPPIEASELNELEISVDVLSEPEIIQSALELDPKRYGVIVSRDQRMGVLLPDLEGVDTIAEQVSIAKQKAGIRPDEEVRLMRFTVTRHA